MDVTSIAAISGVLAKLYDDLKDTAIVSDKSERESWSMFALKVTFIVFMSVYLYLDTFSLYFVCAAMPVFWYTKSMDNDFWKHVTIFPFIILLIKLFKNNNATISLTSQHVYTIIALIILIYYESIHYPEEQSTRKTQFRLFLILIGLIYVSLVSDEITPFAYFGGGYLITNIVFQHVTTPTTS